MLAMIKNDYRWTVPKTEYIYYGLYLPSLGNQELQNLIVVLDSSGSISQKEYDQAATELTAILEAYPCKLHVLHVDTKIQKYEEFSSNDLPIKLKGAGYGGTSFVPAFVWAEKNLHEPPIGLIYLTDMCCNVYPTNYPEYPVLWVCSERSLYYSEPPFGDVIFMDR